MASFAHQADLSQATTLPDASGAALRLRTDPDPAIRAKAALTLDQLHDPATLGALLVALNDPDWFVRSNVGWALVHLGEAARPHVEVIAKTALNEDAREMAQLVLERLA